MTDTDRSRTGVESPGREKAALIAVALQFWINGMVYAAFASRLPEVRDRIGVSNAGLGVVLTAGALGGFVGSFAAERVVAGVGTRRSIIVGSTIGLSALPLIGRTTSPFVVAGVLATISVTDVLVDISMNLQGSWLSSRRQVPVMNRLHGLWSIGSLIGGLATTQLIRSGVSLSTHLLVVALVLAVVLAFTQRHLLHRDEVSTEALVAAEVNHNESLPTGAVEVDERSGPRRGLMDSGFVLFAIPGIAAILVELVNTEWATIRLIDDFGFPESKATWGFVAVTAGMVTGRMGGDWVQARTGPTRLVRISVSMCIFGTVWASLIPWDRWLSNDATLVAVTGGYFLVGMGASVMFPQLYDMAARSFGGSGRGLGFLTAGIRVGALGGPLVIGGLSTAGMSVGTAITLLTVPSCAFILIAMRSASQNPAPVR